LFPAGSLMMACVRAHAVSTTMAWALTKEDYDDLAACVLAARLFVGPDPVWCCEYEIAGLT